MSFTGVKGFESSTYDPVQMGEFILETLVGINQMGKMTRIEKETYKREKYPLVMSFFKLHDLQPTLSNLRLNKEVIIANLDNKPVDQDLVDNMTGAEKEENTTILPALIIITIPVVLFYLIVRI